MKRREALWILALPFYYLLNSFRVELAHALSASLEGAQLIALNVLPTLVIDNGVFLRWTVWQGETTWITAIMPYLLDVLTYLVFFYFCMAIPFQSRWAWFNLIVIGLISPLLNTGLNFFLVSNDIHALLKVFSALVIDLAFGTAIAFYLVGLGLVVFASRTSMPSLPPENSDLAGTVSGESSPE